MHFMGPFPFVISRLTSKPNYEIPYKFSLNGLMSVYINVFHIIVSSFENDQE